MSFLLSDDDTTITYTGQGILTSQLILAPSSEQLSFVLKVIVEGYTQIGTRAFGTFNTMTSVEMPNVITIGDYAFANCSLIESIDIPNVITIGTGAFSECSSLISVNMPNVETIVDSAFFKCVSLTSIDIPKVIVINFGTFQNCTSLVNINIPNVTTIIWRGFMGCTSIISVSLPKVTFIGDDGFRDCISLNNVYMPMIQNIGVIAFRHSALTTITIPDSIDIINQNAFLIGTLETVYISSNAAIILGKTSPSYNVSFFGAVNVNLLNETFTPPSSIPTPQEIGSKIIIFLIV